MKGKLGRATLVIGLACFGGLAALFFGLAGTSGWGLVHNHFGLFLLGFFSILATPVWLLGVVVQGLRNRGRNWQAYELILIVAVLMSLVATLLAFR